jgi:hypothetical protein
VHSRVARLQRYRGLVRHLVRRAVAALQQAFSTSSGSWWTGYGASGATSISAGTASRQPRSAAFRRRASRSAGTGCPCVHVLSDGNGWLGDVLVGDELRQPAAGARHRHYGQSGRGRRRSACSWL